MPELPEAENICRALGRALTGRSITRVEVFTPAMREPLTPLLTDRLEGRRIIDVRRRGRYVIAELDDSRALLMHFGMSGVVRVESPDIPKRKHEHLFLHLDDGRVFKFECTRRFSLFKTVALSRPGACPEELDKLGVEPLTDAFTPDYLYRCAQKSSMPAKCLIMNNSVVTGVGNIYATESLFYARISPLRPAKQLSRQDCAKLTSEIKLILCKAIELGGSTISDFLNVDGSEGKFANELKIYGRNGLSCLECGTEIAAVRQQGRTSAYCPHCQK